MESSSTFIGRHEQNKAFALLRKLQKGVHQYSMQICGVDHIAHGLDAFYKLAEVGHHVFPLNDLGVARKGGRQQSLVDEGLKTHHDGVVCPYLRETLKKEKKKRLHECRVLR